MIHNYLQDIKRDGAALVRSWRAKHGKPRPPAASASLLDHLPYVRFDARHGIFENKKTMGCILRFSPFMGINERAKHALRSLIEQDVPADCTVQILNYASPRIGHLLDGWAQAGRKGELSEQITQKRMEFFQQGSWQSILGHKHPMVVRDFELYLCVSLPRAHTDAGRLETIYQLKALQEKMGEGLKGIQSASYPLNDPDLAMFLQEILTPSLTLYRQPYPPHRAPFTQHFRSEQRVEMCRDHVRLGEFHYRTFEVTGWPDAWDLESSINTIGQFDTGLSMPCPFYISYGFVLRSRAESERMADKTRMLKTQQGDSKLPMFFPKMIEEIQDWRYVSDRINQGERLGKAVMFIVLLASSASQADKAEAMLRDHVAKLKFRMEKITYDTVNSFLTTLPFGIGENWPLLDQLKIPSKMLSGACMNLMPCFADTPSSSQHPLMLLVARRGQIFFFDNFKTAESLNGNFNMVIVGNSGRGKSVWLQEYTTAILKHHGQVIIIDDGRSFQQTCRLLGGDFVDFGGGGFCINPFSLYREPEGSENSKEYQEYFEEPFMDLMLSILCIMINVDKNNAVDPEMGLYRTILGHAVEAVMRKKGCRGGMSDVRRELLTNDRIRSDQTKPIIHAIEYMLRPYSDDGRYASYFNGPSTLQLTNDFTVFELSDLQHNLILQNAVLMTVTFLVYAKTASRERRTALIIDEFWRLGVHPALKGPIEGFARRGRKYNLSLILASQCISDFSTIHSPAGAAALAQSDWRILLSVDGKDEPMLRAELNMSPGEIEMANGLSGLKGAYSEFMIRHKSHSWQIGRLLLDPFSAKLYSTKAEDVAAIQKMQAQGIGVQEAVERLMA